MVRKFLEDTTVTMFFVSLTPHPHAAVHAYPPSGLVWPTMLYALIFSTPSLSPVVSLVGEPYTFAELKMPDA